MPKSNETTTKFKVDISELKRGIQDANRQIRLANAEFKAASSGMDDWGKSADGISAKLTQLDRVLSSQKSILDAYKKQLALIVEEEGENSKGADEMRIKIANQQAAVNKTTAEIKKYEQQLDDLTDSTDDATESIEEMDDATEEASDGFTVMKGALASLVADGFRKAISAVKDFAQGTIEAGKAFEKSMSNVAALSGATNDELELLRQTAKDYGSTTQFSASEAADALGYMALAGWDAKQSASALGGVLNLAAASGMDLASASDMVTDYMSAFNIEAKDSAYFADLLAYAQANANTTAQGLGEAFKNSAANMNAAGQDIETTVSLLAMMANQGLKGSEAGTALTAVMRDMTAKMKDGSITIGKTSVAVMDANGNYRDMTDILADVERATEGMGDAEKAAALKSTFTSDSIKGLNLILNAGVSNASDFEDALRKSSGSAEDMADIMNDNFNGALTATKSKLEGVQIALYEKVQPALNSGLVAFNKFLDALKWLIKNGEKVIAVLGGMAAGVAAYVAYTTAITVMTKGWQALTIATKAQAVAQKVLNAVMALSPTGLIVAGITALVAAFVILWNTSEDFRNFWINLWEQIKEAAGPVITVLVEAFTKAWEVIKPIIDSAVDVFKQAWVKIKEIWDAAQPYFMALWEAIKVIFSVAKNVFETYFKAAWIAVKAVWSVAVGYFKLIWTNIKAIFSVAKAVIGGYFKAAWESIKFVWNTVTGYFRAVWESIKMIFSVVKDVLTGNWAGAWEGIKAIVGTWKDYFSGVWAGIKKVFSTVGSWFKSIFSTAWKAIKNVFKGWKDFFSGLWDTIKDTFGDLGDAIGDTIGSAVIGAINGALSMVEKTINKAIDMINSVMDVINEIPGVDIGNVDEISLPRLANGGVLRRGQVGLLEGSGAEAVVPLENNKRWIAATARDLKRSLADEGMIGGIAGSGKGVVNNYNFVQNNTSPKALSRLEIYRQTRNQLNFAKGV